MRKNLHHLIHTAQYPETADIIIQNGTIIDVFSLDTFQSDIAIKNGYIVGIGNYPTGSNIIDATGKYIIPGFIDGHIHIESTMTIPSEFSKALMKHGVTTVVTDPHEIANVVGTIGIDFMLEDATHTDIDILMKLPSCVPATPFEQNGASLTSEDLHPYLSHNNVIGLAEVMDYPSVLNGNPDMINKINMTLDANQIVDGHGAGLSTTALNVYSAVGIRNDHEAVSVEEAVERTRRGIHVLVREGSAAKDLLAILPAINARNSTQFSFCTDDKHLDELDSEGTVNFAASLAVRNGLDPLIAIQMGTINNARCHGINDKGAIAPGYIADILITNNLKSFNPEIIIKSGKVLDLDNINQHKAEIPTSIQSSIHLRKVTKEDLQIPLQDTQQARIIGVIPKQLKTKKLISTVKVENRLFIPDVSQDFIKIAVCERHHQTGSIGVGIVNGLGLQSGAIASTVAHDSHNLVVAGTNDEDMLLAIQEIENMQGGLVIVNNGEVLATVPLRVGGIMSEKPYVETIHELHYLHEQLATLTEESHNIFMILSFLCLPVIPSLKLTDKGLFDVDSFTHVTVGV